MGKYFQDTVNLLGFGFEVQLAAQLPECTIEAHVGKVKVLHVENQSFPMEGLPKDGFSE